LSEVLIAHSRSAFQKVSASSARSGATPEAKFLATDPPQGLKALRRLGGIASHEWAIFVSVVPANNAFEMSANRRENIDFS
jgi:hypothetical protein